MGIETENLTKKGRHKLISQEWKILNTFCKKHLKAEESDIKIKYFICSRDEVRIDNLHAD